MVKGFVGAKKKRLIAIIVSVAVALILTLGGYFLYRGGYIFADTEGPLDRQDLQLVSLRDGIIAYNAMSVLGSEDDSREFTYVLTATELFDSVPTRGKNANTDYPVEARATIFVNTLSKKIFGEDDIEASRGVNTGYSQYIHEQMRLWESAYVALYGDIAEAGDTTEDIVKFFGFDGSESPITALARNGLIVSDDKAVAMLAQVNASAVARAAETVLSDDVYLAMARDEEAYLALTKGAPGTEFDTPNVGGSLFGDGTGGDAQTATGGGGGTGGDAQTATGGAALGPCADKGRADANCQKVIDAVRAVMKIKNGTLHAAMTQGSNFAINPNTGRLEYVSWVKNGSIGGVAIPEGQIWWDPFTQTYSGYVSADYKGYNASLFADARSGDIYMALSRADKDALVELGGVKLMDVRIGDNGKIGGKFQYQNRVFYYNPELQGFEVPIAIGGSRLVNFMSETVTNEKGENIAPLGVIYLDSNGKVRGRVDLPDKIGGSLFIDQDGTIAYGRTITDGDTVLGSVFVDSTGNFGGQVDIAQAIGTDLNIFVGFDRKGFTGVSTPIGSFGGAPISVGIGRDGGLTIGGAIPIGGLPLPISIGQDEHGNFTLGIPFLGSIKIFGNENRPLAPPELKNDEDGGMDTSCIYFRHSFKKLLKTVRVYQVPCTEIEKEEQMQRGALIFDVYNELLERNPSLEEFVHWYFYGGHMLYEFPKHETDKAYRQEMTETRLNQWVTCKGQYDLAKNIIPNDPKDNCNEYKWIEQGNEGVNAATRPDNIMQVNPFDESTWEQVENTEGGETQSPLIQDFLDELEGLRENDPGVGLGDYYEQLEGQDLDNARANVDLGDAQVETVSLTRGGDYPVIEKLKDNTGLVITLRKGFNEVFTPDEVGYISLVGVESDGIKAFEYDPTYSTDANKSWIVSPQTMKPGTGYYLYNSGNAGRRIVLRKKSSLEAGEKDTVLKKGWNLLVNSTSDTIKLGDYTVKTALSGWSGGCDIIGLCVGDAKIGDLISSDAKKTRAYQKLYFLVSETDSAKINKLVEVDALKSDYLKKIELKPGQIFWIYLYE